MVQLLLDVYEQTEATIPWQKMLYMAMLFHRHEIALELVNRRYHLDPYDIVAERKFFQKWYPCCTSFFHTAVTLKLKTIAFLMVKQHPRILQQKWLKKCRVTTRTPVFVQLLKELSQHPLTLQQICKDTIRSTLGQNIVANVKQLPLPQRLQEYVTEN